jgi:hypothetical protein
MHDQLEPQLFSMVASAHVASGGIIRITRRGYDWGILHMGDDITFMHGSAADKEPHGTVYVTPESAVDAFVQHFALLGIKHDPNTSPVLDDTEFFFDGIHANVAVTWRHLKSRFKGIKMILKRTDRRVMEEIIEEAASL